MNTFIRQPSQCRNCGASILWMNRSGSDRFAPPLAAESGTAGYCIQGDGSVLYTMMWQKHECTLEAMHAWDVLNAKRANHAAAKALEEELKKGPGQMHIIPDHDETWSGPRAMSAEEETARADAYAERQAQSAEERYQAARAGQYQALAERREIAWNDALKRPCPKCEASRGVQCWNANKSLKNKKHNVRPHAERMSASTRRELGEYY